MRRNQQRQREGTGFGGDDERRVGDGPPAGRAVHGSYGQRDWQRGSTPPHYGETANPPAPAGDRGRGPKDHARSDARIRDDLCDLLSLDERLDATGIEVGVDAGAVVLSGTVARREDKRAAEQIAESVRGVADVRNQLRTLEDRAAARPPQRGSTPRR